ncbi:LuxR C-terminal-related transcriptional regulator [uncultured Desulfobacter sp.]|uniref:helix-turn-helix transcriptional regulator n=1 Tax=uncultured Desulfobacter sp. TaxID=240139 RepID=UPI0029F4F3B4|nr:LuxR C-terminal-related transcriptional regulator [uncultured Desulfobacter sp.]
MSHIVEQPDIEALVRRNRELEQLEQDHRRMELIFKQQAHNLQERMKEINCLYGISKILEQAGLSLEDTFQQVVNLIPPSWQYPEITCAQLLINDQSFRTKNYKNTFWKQQAKIIAYGEPIGILTVCYLEKRPDMAEGPFLAEERSLINAVAELLGRTIKRKQAEAELRESRRKLKDQNQQLKEKNIALREVMSQLREEKVDLEKRVLANVENLLLPLIKKMEDQGSDLDKGYLLLLEENIARLTSSFGTKISQLHQRLTPRENEICNMIRTGLSSKEIGKMLNLSYRSVETYRNHIRKKLGISNKKINLTSYLAGL